MSRPATFFTWAVEVDYGTSINPWSGLSLVTVPLADYFTPGVAIAAEDVNYVVQTLANQDAALLSMVGAMDGTNWQTYTPVGSLFVPTWNAYFGRWETSVIGSSPAGTISVSYDGVTFTQLSSTSLTNVLEGVLIANPAGNSVFVEATTESAVITGTTVTKHTGTGFSWDAAFQLQGTYFNNLYVVWGVNSGVTAMISYSSADGATWSSQAVMLSNAVQGAFFSKSPTQLLVFPAMTSPTQYAISTNGTSWAAAALPTLTGYQVSGAHYDSAAGLYVFLATNGTASVLYTSSTGAAGSWTAVSSTTLAAHNAYQLSGNGTEWLSIIFVDSVGRVVTSIDGGQTWQFTRLPAVSASTATLQSLKATTSTGSQFAIGGLSTGSAVSHAVGPMSTVSH